MPLSRVFPSAPVNVQVLPPDNTPPTVAITAPAQGATVSGIVSVIATASDNVSVAQVEVFADGVSIGIVQNAPYVVNWTTGPNRQVRLQAVATDLAGNTGSSTAIFVTVQNVPPPTPDTTKPVVAITSPVDGAVVNGVVTVAATATDNIAVASVEFFANGVSLGSRLVSPYSISWATGANGNYELSALATDSSGNQKLSVIVRVTVSQIIVDPTPPTCAVTYPTAALVLSGTVGVTVAATDNIGVTGVIVRINGSPIGNAVAAPFVVPWVTGANGAYTVDAIASDAAGNTTLSAPVNVTVLQPDTIQPTVTMTAPFSGQSFVTGSSTTFQAQASDNVGVVGVQFKEDGVNVGAEVTTPPYAVTGPVGNVGSHTISATARDAAGNSATASVPITVTATPPPVDTTPPTVSLTAPVNNQVLTGNFTLTATAADNVGVVGVQFRVNGSNLGTEILVAPYMKLWNVSGLPNGTYTFDAIARDLAGNTTTSQPVTANLQVAPPPPPPPPGTGLLGSSNLIYQGAFQIPGSDDAHSANFGGNALAYKASTNTLIISGMDVARLVGEISIPTPVNSSNLSSLPTATLIHNWTDVLSGHVDDIAAPGTNGIFVGGLLVANGELIVDSYVYFDTDAVLHPTSHFRSALNFSGYLGGPYQIGNPAASGFVAGYMAEIPASWQAALGGPAFTGQNTIPIIGRTSYGPSVTVFNPAQLGVVSPVPATRVLGYDAAHHPLGDWASGGSPNLAPGNLLVWNGSSPSSGCAFPTTHRSVLFFGTHGSGPFCYGIETDNQGLAGTISPTGDIYCYDPMNNGGKGPSNYPYTFYVWAYDANDLAAVKAGSKNFYDVFPYLTWTFTLPIMHPTGLAAKFGLGGVAYNPGTNQIYIVQKHVDAGDASLVHVFQVL